MSDFILNAEVRDNKGKGASRRLRRLDSQVPAIIYGEDKAPLSIMIPHKDLIRALDEEAFYSAIITVKLGNEEETVILKDLQRHPAKPVVVHADFLRVSADSAIVVKVPLHYVNAEACVGVKMEGGTVITQLNEIEVKTLPATLPEFLEVDLTDVAAGQTLHISDVILPEGVESVALANDSDHNLAILTVKKPKGKQASEEGDAESSAE